MGEFSQADTTQIELAVHRTWTTAATATGVTPNLELRLFLLLLDERLLRHGYCPSRLNGKP